MTKKYDTLKLSSSAFKSMDFIPKKYSCDGENISPPLEISGIPPETKSLFLALDDHGVLDHWVIWNISPDIKIINEGELPVGAVEGMNDFDRHSYFGPCPVSGTHKYFFKLYAIDKILDVDSGFRKIEIFNLIQNNILDHAELVFLYKK